MYLPSQNKEHCIALYCNPFLKRKKKNNNNNKLFISPCVLADPTKNQCKLVNVHFVDQKENSQAKGIKTKTLEYFKLKNYLQKDMKDS